MSATLWAPVREESSRVQVAFRTLLGAVLVFAGTTHLTTARETFQAQVPAWVPLNENFVVIASGLVELALGAALLALLASSFAPRRVIVGLVVTAFFVAIFPGNVGQYVEHQEAFGLDTDGARLVRLFFQPVLVAWALWSTGAWGPLAEQVRRLRGRAR